MYKRQAGAAAAAAARPSIRVSSIDNYQGEESRIVILSLVRSNDRGDIGFLKQPQRVNVALSRAREGLILLGNANCLVQGSRGSRTWDRVLEHVPQVAGFPVVCEMHGERALLTEPEAFARLAPDGGCPEDCGAVLPCGHRCSMKCHSASVPHAPCVVPVTVKCAARRPAGAGQCHLRVCCSCRECRSRTHLAMPWIRYHHLHLARAVSYYGARLACAGALRASTTSPRAAVRSTRHRAITSFLNRVPRDSTSCTGAARLRSPRRAASK